MSNNNAPKRKPREVKPKIFGTFLITEDGKEQLVGYTEHYTKTQAQAKCLYGRIETRLASTDDLIRIGRDNIDVDRLPADFDDERQIGIDDQQ